MTVSDEIPINNTRTPSNSPSCHSNGCFNNMITNVRNKINKSNTLHVVSVISNPANFQRRYELMREFINRMEHYNGLSTSNKKTKCGFEFYVVELVYGDQNFIVTDKKKRNHLQLKTLHPLWHKENMINLAVKNLLPDNWKYMAWIDADIEFDSHHWYKDTVKLLKNKYDIVQLFSVALDLSDTGTTNNMWQSYGYKYIEGFPNENKKGVNYWHPGYAWAITRRLYKRMGGLIDFDIIGSGDFRMASLFNNKLCYYSGATDEYKTCVNNFANNVNNVLLGYVPGIIRHYYHGDKKNRKYVERNDILKKYKYNPTIFITYDDNGIVIPTDKFPKEMLEDIVSYFCQRNEDDIYNKN